MKKIRIRKLRLLNLTAMLLRGLAAVLPHWPWALLILCFISPVSPHMRWKKDSVMEGDVYITSCDYIGLRGVVHDARQGNCPPFALIYNL